jgi:hypothetical protein
MAAAALLDWIEGYMAGCSHRDGAIRAAVAAQRETMPLDQVFQFVRECLARTEWNNCLVRSVLCWMRLDRRFLHRNNADREEITPEAIEFLATLDDLDMLHVMQCAGIVPRHFPTGTERVRKLRRNDEFCDGLGDF